MTTTASVAAKRRRPNMVRGARAIEAASLGAKLFVFNDQRGWVEAGPGALGRAKRMESWATWIYGVRSHEARS